MRRVGPCPVCESNLVLDVMLAKWYCPKCKHWLTLPKHTLPRKIRHRIVLEEAAEIVKIGML